MLKNIVVNFFKLLGGIIAFIATLLLGEFVSSTVIDYCINNDMKVSTAYLFGMCSLILVLGLVIGTICIVVSEMHDYKLPHT